MPIQLSITNNGGNPATSSSLQAVGAVDTYLTHDPDVTLWRRAPQQCTNFALENTSHFFQNRVGFGQIADVNIPRVADLLRKAYVHITLPPLSVEVNEQENCRGGKWGMFPIYKEWGRDGQVFRKVTSFTGSARAFWINSIGFAIVKQASYHIGGTEMDVIDNHYQFAYDELAHGPGKALAEMVGRYDTIDECIIASQKSQELFVPLMFSWGLTDENAAPLISLQFHSFTINVKFEELKYLVAIALPADLAPEAEDADPSDPTNPYSPMHYRVLNADTGCPLCKDDLEAVMDLSTVYLDEIERNIMADETFVQVVQHVQRQEFTIDCKSAGTHRESLQFNHPVTEMWVTVQREDAVECGDYFNYDSHDPSDEPIKAMQLLINHQQRTAGSGKFYRLVQPYEAHTNMSSQGGVHGTNIYDWSFASSPESANPTGSLNFSRIDNAQLVFDFNDDSAPEGSDCCACEPHSSRRVVRIYARFWNVLSYRKGLGGLKYSN